MNRHCSQGSGERSRWFDIYLGERMDETWWGTVWCGAERSGEEEKGIKNNSQVDGERWGKQEKGLLCMGVGRQWIVVMFLLDACEFWRLACVYKKKSLFNSITQTGNLQLESERIEAKENNSSSKYIITLPFAFEIFSWRFLKKCGQVSTRWQYFFIKA